jgi:hypothetical protein
MVRDCRRQEHSCPPGLLGRTATAQHAGAADGRASARSCRTHLPGFCCPPLLIATGVTSPPLATGLLQFLWRIPCIARRVSHIRSSAKRQASRPAISSSPSAQSCRAAQSTTPGGNTPSRSQCPRLSRSMRLESAQLAGSRGSFSMVCGSAWMAPFTKRHSASWSEVESLKGLEVPAKPQSAAITIMARRRCRGTFVRAAHLDRLAAACLTAVTALAGVELRSECADTGPCQGNPDHRVLAKPAHESESGLCQVGARAAHEVPPPRKNSMWM